MAKTSPSFFSISGRPLRPTMRALKPPHPWAAIQRQGWSARCWFLWLQLDYLVAQRTEGPDMVSIPDQDSEFLMRLRVCLSRALTPPTVSMKTSSAMARLVTSLMPNSERATVAIIAISMSAFS